jgi:hypothetical protein
LTTIYFLTLVRKFKLSAFCNDNFLSFFHQWLSVVDIKSFTMVLHLRACI